MSAAPAPDIAVWWARPREQADTHIFVRDGEATVRVSLAPGVVVTLAPSPPRDPWLDEPATPEEIALMATPDTQFVPWED